MKRKIALNTFIPLLLQVVTIISGFIIPRLILGFYGSKTNGLVNSITQFLSVISFLEMGVGSVVRYNLYSPLNDGDTYKMSCVYVSAQKYYRTIASILLVYVLLLCFFYQFLVKSDFDGVFSGTLIAVLSVSLFLQYYFGQVEQILLTADQKSYIPALIQIVAVILNTLFCALLINLGFGIHFVKLFAAIVFAVKPIFLHWYVKKNYSIQPDVKYEGEPINQKWNGMAQHISSVVLDQTDVIVLTVFSSLTNVSIYSVYHLVVNGIKILLLSMTNGIEAYIGSLIAKNDKNKLNEVFKSTEWVIHTVTTVVFSCTMALIVPFVMVYTKGITDANYNVPLFALLITIANAGHCLRLPYSILILSAGHYKQTQWNYIASASINIVVSILFVSTWGLVGVAIGTIVAMFFQTFWMAWYTAKNIVDRDLISFFKQVFVDIVAFISVYLISSLFSLGSTTYLAWLFMAIKILGIALVVELLLNIVFYRDKVFSLRSILQKRENNTI